MYADTVTRSMRTALDETERRRVIQLAWNERHGIEPEGISKQIRDITDGLRVAEESPAYVVATDLPRDELLRMIKELESQMKFRGARAGVRARGPAPRPDRRAAPRTRRRHPRGLRAFEVRLATPAAREWRRRAPRRAAAGR